MRNRLVVLLAIVVGLAIIGSLVFLVRSQRQQTPGTENGNTPVATSPSSGHTIGSTPTPGTTPTSPSKAGSIESRIDNLYARLQSGEATAEDVEALRRELLAADPQRAIAIIRGFLESGLDISTGQDFMIGGGGVLANAPTLRTLLLDTLGQISRKTGSDAAAILSRSILEKKDSPDEWAVAMRNIGWHDSKAKPYLAGKVREMLSHQPWVQQPSAGFLESFDIIAYSEDPAFIPDLANLLRGESVELQRASAVALDRLSEMAPLEVMTYLNTHPNELADRPFLRADYYAKADLGNPKQIQALEAYLARTDVSVPEKSKLLQALATPASFVSDNLLTPAPSSDVDDTQRHRHLGQTLDQWMKQNKYPELHSEMAEIRQRLGQ